MFGISFTWMRNKIGPRIVPWGTPDVTADQLEYVPRIPTLCCLFVRNCLNHNNKGPSIYQSIYISHTVTRLDKRFFVSLNLFFFFLTSQTYPTRLDLKECDISTDHRIQLRPTLPIRGSEPIELRFGVPETFEDQALPERCLITLQPGEEMEWTNISVQAVCDNTNQEFSPQVFTFTVVTFIDFWFGYELPAITVSPANILLPSRRSVWENIYPDSDYRPNTARTVHATKVKILPIRLPKLLRCLLYGKREQFNSTVMGNWHFCLRTAIT